MKRVCSARFLESAKLGNVPLLAGVIPLKSAKMGAWLNEKVPGVRVPGALLEEMERAGPEGEAAKGVEIAARTIRELRSICNGVHVMAIGWEQRIPEILRTAGVAAVAAGVDVGVGVGVDLDAGASMLASTLALVLTLAPARTDSFGSGAPPIRASISAHRAE